MKLLAKMGIWGFLLAKVSFLIPLILFVFGFACLGLKSRCFEVLRALAVSDPQMEVLPSQREPLITDGPMPLRKRYPSSLGVKCTAIRATPEISYS